MQKEIQQQKQQIYTSLSLSSKQLEETVKSLQSEIKTDLLSELTQQEQEELVVLNEAVTQLKKDLISSSKIRADLESKKMNLENLLNTNLRKRKEELSENLETLHLNEQEVELKQKQKELESVQAAIGDVSNRVKVIGTEIETKNQKIDEQKRTVEEMRSQENEQARALQAESENMEKLLNKRSLLLQKKEDCERKIREIGSLPTSEVETHKDNTLKQLMKLLHQTNTDLKGYSHVNKKALDQFLQFTEKRDQLNKRKDQLDISAKKISELITVLDEKKEAAIQRTFKGVAQQFQAVFSTLVPGGTASLKVKGGKKISELEGVKITVSFSGGGERFLLEQLSGGQKSLVALALIFAIQRCDPAPFYLFDEIDAALDPNTRSAVANMIQAESRKEEEKSGTQKTQFIVSTFRPEFVREAHKCYCVTLAVDEGSSINPISKEEALKVIQEEQNVNKEIQ